jgi:hypothetical protein
MTASAAAPLLVRRSFVRTLRQVPNHFSRADRASPSFLYVTRVCTRSSPTWRSSRGSFCISYCRQVHEVKVALPHLDQVRTPGIVQPACHHRGNDSISHPCAHHEHEDVACSSCGGVGNPLALSDSLCNSLHPRVHSASCKASRRHSSKGHARSSQQAQGKWVSEHRGALHAHRLAQPPAPGKRRVGRAIAVIERRIAVGSAIDATASAKEAQRQGLRRLAQRQTSRCLLGRCSSCEGSCSY